MNEVTKIRLFAVLIIIGFGAAIFLVYKTNQKVNDHEFIYKYMHERQYKW